nr:MAG TPA: hypothetical protein [Caudoviricetes sp.]DAO51727.1 MAG TPA: hypothetical protein [Caudoviricetes sp.]
MVFSKFHISSLKYKESSSILRIGTRKRRSARIVGIVKRHTRVND